MVQADQFSTDSEGWRFFLRMVFFSNHFQCVDDVLSCLAPVQEKYDATLRFFKPQIYTDETQILSHGGIV